MLGLFFIYFIGRLFYQLAIQYHQKKWLYAVLSIVVYYAGSFCFALIIFVVGELITEGFTDQFTETEISLIALPFGLASVYGFYKILEYNWKKLPVPVEYTIDQIGYSDVPFANESNQTPKSNSEF